MILIWKDCIHQQNRVPPFLNSKTETAKEDLTKQINLKLNQITD